jgi:hypothetical protein
MSKSPKKDIFKVKVKISSTKLKKKTFNLFGKSDNHVFESFLEIFSPKKVLFRGGSKIFSCQNVSDDIVYTTNILLILHYAAFFISEGLISSGGFLRAVFGGAVRAAAGFFGRFFGRAGLDGLTGGGHLRAVFGAARVLAKTWRKNRPDF